MPESVKRVFDDLLNIEVNTMVKSGMTGRKMPAIGHALLDIHGGYESWLNAYTLELNEQWGKFRQTPDAAEFRDRTIADGSDGQWWVIQGGALIADNETTPPFDDPQPGPALFDDMRKRARTADEMHRLMNGRRGYTVRDGGDVMLKRIVRNCDQLKAIIERAATGDRAPELTRKVPSGITGADVDDVPRDDLITIRKAWEMGTEVIAMQTVVQLDGDIVTRLNSAYASDRHQPVRELHRESVASALAHWRYLVDTAVSIGKSIAGGVF